MADKITNDITLLFKTKLDEKSKQEVGKNLKGLLENAAIGFDEAETKRNVEPIIQMIKRLFDKAEIAFDADKLLAMPSRQALEEMAKIEVNQLQMAFDKALAKSGGVKIDFGDIGLSELAAPLKQIESELSDISRKIADTTKKSVYEIEQSLESLNKRKKKDKIRIAASPEGVEEVLAGLHGSKAITPAKAVNSLEKARDLYTTSVKEDNPWVLQYKYLLDFVSKYERLTKDAKNKIEAERPELTQLYDMLSPKAGAVKISLEHYVDVARGNELSEYKNQPWGRETTLKQIRDSLKNGITVKEGSGGGDNNPPKEPPKEPPKTPDKEPPKTPKSSDGSKNKTPNTKITHQKPADDNVADTSAFNQKLFDAIEKLSKDIEAAFKSMMNEEIDEDQLDDKMYDLRKDFVKQFQFEDSKRASDYLSEQSDDMGSWDSNKIYKKLSKQLSQTDPSWPKITSGATDGIETENNSLSKQETLLEKIQKLTSYIDDNYLSSGKHLSDFLDDIQRESTELDGELKEILTTLNLIDDKGNLTFDIKRNGEEGGGTTHNGALISDEFVLIERGDYESVKNSRLPESTQNAAKDGVNVAEVLGYLPSKHTGGFFDVQGTAKGHNLFENGVISQDVVEATEDQLEQLVQAFIKARDYGFDIENGGSNIVYDKEKGFSFYDLEELSVDDAEFWNSKTEAEKKLMALENLFSLFSGINRDHSNFDNDKGVNALAERIKGIVESKGIVKPNDVDDAGRNYEDIYDDVFSGNIEDESDDIIARLQAEEDAHRKNAASIKEEKRAQEEANQSFLDGVLAAARARASLEYTEVDSSSEVAAEKAETDAIKQQNDALKENIDLKERANVQNDGILVNDDAKPDTTKLSSGSTEVKASIDTEELRGLLNSITYNVKVIQDTEPDGNKVSIDASELKGILDSITYNVKLAQGELDGESNKIAIDEGILENVLNRITYDVKIAHDDADKTANKIAIDESALESTLNRVFSNILSPKDDGKKPERKKEPWALEKTLNTTIKGALDQIQTNTAKPEAIEIAPSKTEVGNVLATENTLGAIRTAVEAINKKVVKGTKAKTSDSDSKKKTGVGKKNSESYDNSRYFPEKLKTQTMQLAKFRAQLMTTGKLTDDVDSQIYELLDGLKQVQNGPDFSAWMQKFQQLKTSVGITDIFDKAEGKEVAASYQQLIEFQKTRNKLELQYEKAQDGSALKQFYAEQLAQMDAVIAKQQEMLENEEYEAKLAKMQEEQARKLGEIEAKAATKDAKKQAANAKKLAQREAMLGKTGNAVGRAESTWVSAIGIEGDLPDGFTAQIDEYYQKLDTLRKKHQELKNSDMISEEQKKDLIAQTMEINKMTSEIGELVAEYQKLSGDNTSVIGTNALGADAGIGAYEQQLKQAVVTATNGKAQIKSFDAATKTLTYTVKTGKNEFTEYTAAVRRADGALVSVQGATKRTETFFEATARKMKELTSYFSGMAVFNRVGQELRRGIQYVREIDLALTELKKVTDETEETYDKFLDTAAKTAEKVGSTIQKVVSSTADWARLGYSMEQAAKFAESTQILMNVSEFTDVSQATDTLISSVQAFGYTAETSMEVVDLLNTIGNNYAISTADLAQSLTKSSASLVAAGGDLAEAAALTATANAIIQDADSVGTALKTTSLRLRGTSVKVLEEEGLDSDGAIESTSKLRSQVLATSGVDILTNSGAYKSTYQILLEIAEVWDQITDDKARAGLLELLAGKRNSSVIAALLQNPEDLKAAYEDAQNAAGSALEENTKYLDSIQGKIDQFNNAMQAMWSNTLDSDWVKGFVALGTEIIKVIDKIGLLNTALIALATYSMIKNKMGPIAFLGGISDLIRDVVGKVGGFIGSLTGMTAATSAYTAETLAASVANGTLSASEAASIATKSGLILATTNLTAAEAAEMLMSSGVAKADALAMVAKLGLTSSTQALSLADIQAAVSSGALTAAQGAQIASALGLTAANTGLAASFMALWTALWPILALMAGVAVIWGIVKAIDAAVVTTAELEEKLDDLNSEISDTKSELDSLNSELETTQDRMEELLAMESLSFTEEEELKNLKLKNAELERQIKLQEQMLKAKEEEAKNTAKEVIAKKWDSSGADKAYTISATGVISRDTWNATGVDTKDALDEAIQEYERVAEVRDKVQKALLEWKDGDNEHNQSVLKKYGLNSALTKETMTANLTVYDEHLRDQQQGINMVLKDMSDIITENGLSYSMGDEDINKFLDEYYAYSIKWANAQGTASKSSVISAIWDNTESEAMAGLKEELDEIAKSDSADKQVEAQKLIQGALDDTTGQYERLKTFMGTVGVTAEEMAKYFVAASEAPDIGTIEGITEVYQDGIGILGKYKDARDEVLGQDENGEDITWNNLFTQDESGKKVADKLKIASILEGSDEAIREEFAKMAEAVENGEMEVDAAIKSFGISGSIRGFELIEEQISALNADIFKDLDDELSGVIDTFSEFGAALESVANSMEILNTAQTQMNNSGRISVKTALDLINSTDQWNEVLKIENGTIRLVDNAEDILIQTKLDHIKTNLQAALSTVNAQLAQIEATGSAEELATTLEESTNMAVRSLAENMSYLSALVGAFASGNWLGATKAAEDAKAATANQLNYKRGTSSNISTAALEEKKRNIEAQLGMLEGIDTTSEFKDNYDFDKTPGDKYDDEDDAFQRAMDYWENRIAANQAKYEQLQNEIDLLEAKGQKADASYYEEQIKLEDERKSLLEQQRTEAQKYLKEIESMGLEGSDEWWEIANTLNDIESELDDVTASIVDLQDAIAEIDTYKFEEFNTRLDNLINKLGTIRDIIASDEEDWFDDEGSWTEAGVAVLGTYVQELELYKNALEEVNAEREKYAKSYAGNEAYYETLGIHSEQEYYDKVEELTEQQYDYAESINDTEQSIVDMYESSIDAVEEYIDTLIDGYNDYIDSVKEALDAERDLYEFKKNVQKQSKDIAELERKIASLSGSTNKSEIAERRKLEAQLYEARESLNDTYYDHSKDAQNEALDAEQSAYEETMNKFVRGMRESLETVTQDMDKFLGDVTTMVSLNAGTILSKYQETELPLDDALTNPWEAAKEAVGNYSGNALELMNTWAQNGFLTDFPNTVQNSLESPWKAGQSAVDAFKTNVDTQMKNVVSSIETNIKTASGKLSALYQQIEDTAKKAAEVSGGGVPPKKPNPNTGGDYTPDVVTTQEPEVKLRGLMQTSKEMILGSKSFVDANTETINGVKYYRDSKTGYYYKISDLNSNRKYDGGRTTGWAIPKGTWFYTKHAKGTTSTTRDEWAITDEPQFGDELVLVPGKDGNLSFMRKGTGVVPADMTQKLFELAQIPTSDLMNKNLTAIVPNITKNDFKNEFNFESLVHVDTVDSDTLPKLEKMVDKKIDDFSKSLNYSLKKFTR